MGVTQTDDMWSEVTKSAKQ